MISELSPNSTNVSGSDAYEYLQIFNVSDQSVAVNNYQLVYVNGNKETVWKLDDDIVLDAKEVLTVWVVNETVEQTGLTVAYLIIIMVLILSLVIILQLFIVME